MRSIDPDDDDFSDLDRWAEALEGVQVVALGEASHHDGPAFLAKTRLVRFLHARLGFDVLAWEHDAADSPRVRERLKAGDTEAAISTWFEGWRDARELSPMFDYLTAHAPALEFVGFDEQGEDRSRKMANHLIQEVESRPGRRVIVWAHAAHVARSTSSVCRLDGTLAWPGSVCMGEYLARRWDDAYYAVGQTSCGGSHGTRRWGRNRDVRAPVAGGLEASIMAARSPPCLLDLRRTSGGGEGLREPQTCMAISYYPKVAVWPLVYDAVLCTATAAPSRRVAASRGEPQQPE